MLTCILVVCEEPADCFGDRPGPIHDLSPCAQQYGLQGLACPVAVDSSYNSVNPGGNGG